ncbi:MAG TPA: hypothetical protein VD883_04495, partial [Candidatus Omnitrophota bacterium]|nr:hypothetical protein [Candidatus Omnitrophota bacterium]
KEEEMRQIGQFIDETLSNIGSPEKIASVKAGVKRLTDRFPLYPELLQTLAREEKSVPVHA